MPNPSAPLVRLPERRALPHFDAPWRGGIDILGGSILARAGKSRVCHFLFMSRCKTNTPGRGFKSPVTCSRLREATFPVRPAT